MKINKLIFDKACYPRGRDQTNDNKIEPDAELVKHYQDVIKQDKKIPTKTGNIVYNKRTMHVLDGWHRLIAAGNEGWTEIPNSVLTVMDIPIEKELWVSAQLNSTHGKQLNQAEKKAILKAYWVEERTLKYGTPKEFSKDFAIHLSNVYVWMQDFERESAGILVHETKGTTSDRLVESNEKADKLQKELTETREELNKVKTDARQAFWEMICEQHQEEIKGCKKCGK